jgi:hypothetical protein
LLVEGDRAMGKAGVTSVEPSSPLEAEALGLLRFFAGLAVGAVMATRAAPLLIEPFLLDAVFFEPFFLDAVFGGSS